LHISIRDILNIKAMSKKKKLKIELNEWNYKCGDGCCDLYGTTTTVNGVELDTQNIDASTILKHVLKHLGYDVEIINTYDD